MLGEEIEVPVGDDDDFGTNLNQVEITFIEDVPVTSTALKDRVRVSVRTGPVLSPILNYGACHGPLKMGVKKDFERVTTCYAMFISGR